MIMKKLSAILALVVTVAAHGAIIGITNINTGTGPNTGTGDTLRSAGFKMNASVSALSNAVENTHQPFKHVRRNDMFQVWDSVSMHTNTRFGEIGDSVTHNGETLRGVRLAFDGYMDSGGYRTMFDENFANTGANLLFYMDNLSPVYSGYSPSFFCPMTAGQTTTSVFANGSQYADTGVVDYHAGPELSVYTVQTNGGASWGTRATIDATVGTAGALYSTNLSLPLGNYNIRVTSSASNNLANVGLMRLNSSTNTHTWARMARPGEAIINIVTNAGFWKFYTNYAPHCLFFEAKDSAVEIILAMNWVRTNLTNSANVWIVPAPTQDGSDLPAANAMIDFARTNAGVILFNKRGLFEPVDFWFGLMPTNTANIFYDTAHLGAKGINYASSAFAQWFGAGHERFRMCGLQPRVDVASVDISGKANLAGGNSFSGVQVFNNYIVLTNAQLLIRGSSANAEVQFWDPVGNSQIVRQKRRADTEMMSFVYSGAGDISLFTITNSGGNIFIQADTGVPMRFGTLRADSTVVLSTNAPPSNTSTPVSWVRVMGTNGATFYLPGYQ